MMNQPCVYILSSNNKQSLYIGVTSQLKQRVWQHKNKQVNGFSYRYNTINLVYSEIHNVMESAISREKQLKHWKRQWKSNLITEHNKEWVDLYDQL